LRACDCRRRHNVIDWLRLRRSSVDRGIGPNFLRRLLELDFLGRLDGLDFLGRLLGNFRRILLGMGRSAFAVFGHVVWNRYVVVVVHSRFFAGWLGRARARRLDWWRRW
jgi:hypothetical protein